MKLVFLRPFTLKVRVSVFFTLLPVVLFLLLGCSEKETTPAPSPTELQITWQTWLPDLLLASPEYHPLRVISEGVPAAQIDSVSVTIRDASQQVLAEFQLYDDGNAYSHNDALAFCQPYSGDNVPHDGQFCRIVNSLFTVQEGSFTLQTTAWIGSDSATTEKDTLEVIFDIQTTWLTLLPNLVLQSPSYLPLQVTITGVYPPIIDSVRANIFDANAQVIGAFQLYDDGGALAHGDALSFCSPYSGDSAPDDGHFSRLVNSLFTAQEGYYTVQVTAWSRGDSALTGSDTVAVFLSAPPQVSLISVPDSLLSGFGIDTILVQAVEPDPVIDSVVVVEMRLYSPAGSLIGNPYVMTDVGNDEYELTITDSFAIGLPSANYTMAFRAYDTFNLESDSVGQLVFIENLAPFLSNPVLPDTLELPSPPGAAVFTSTITCWDEQTLADLIGVTLQALKPDSTWGTLIDLYDDGNIFFSGDSTAGDSVYSRSLTIDYTNDPGLYQFYFRAEDQAGNQAQLIDSLWIVVP